MVDPHFIYRYVHHCTKVRCPLLFITIRVKKNRRKFQVFFYFVLFRFFFFFFFLIKKINQLKNKTNFRWVLNLISVSTELTFMVFYKADYSGIRCLFVDTVTFRVKILDLVVFHEMAFFFRIVTYGQSIVT